MLPGLAVPMPFRGRLVELRIALGTDPGGILDGFECGDGLSDSESDQGGPEIELNVIGEGLWKGDIESPETVSGADANLTGDKLYFGVGHGLLGVDAEIGESGVGDGSVGIRIPWWDGAIGMHPVELIGVGGGKRFDDETERGGLRPPFESIAEGKSDVVVGRPIRFAMGDPNRFSDWGNNPTAPAGVGDPFDGEIPVGRPTGVIGFRGVIGDNFVGDFSGPFPLDNDVGLGIELLALLPLDVEVAVGQGRETEGEESEEE